MDQTTARVKRLEYEEITESKYITETKSRYPLSEFNVEVELKEKRNVLENHILKLIHLISIFMDVLHSKLSL